MPEKINIELYEIIKIGECITTEFKKATNKLPTNLFETVCSFLNRNGGNIFLGIEDNGSITGIKQEYVQQMKKDFANLCNNEQKISPTVYLNIKDYNCDIILRDSTYINNTIAGALCNKLNLNYDYIRNLLGNSEMLRITFPDKRNYNIDLNYSESYELNLLINLIYLTDIKFIYIRQPNKDEYPFLLKLELY